MYLFNPYGAGDLFCQYKMMQKNLENDWNPAHGYLSESSSWEPSSEYQHCRDKMIFKGLCILVIWTKFKPRHWKG